MAALVDTRAYFPSREEAERFARQFEGERFRVAIQPEPRQGREVYQVHVQQVEGADGASPSRMPLAGGLALGPDRELAALLGNVGERARRAGLDSEVLARRMGHALGEAIAQKEVPRAPARREALAHLGTLLLRCGMGQLTVVSATPLVLRVQAPATGAMGADHGSRRCVHVAGFLEGALGVLLEHRVEAREMDCVGLGNPYCTFTFDF